MTRSVLLLFLPLLVQAADVTGQWYLQLIQFGDSNSARVEMKADGNTVSGRLNELKLTGTVKDNQLQLKMVRPDGKDWGTLTGRVDGDEIKGKGRRGDQDEFDWVARRLKTGPTTPATHEFVPTKFHRLFSGTIEPVLRIHPGDTVKTTTVDAGGRDGAGKVRSMGGNPETGPFYVEGTVPGDTLVVKFRRIRLNRDSAGSGNRIVPSAVTASYYRDAKFNDEYGAEWKLDREAGTAVLAKPSERLKNFKVKLQPMLGCVGVAPPARQAYRSGWLGSWGGNMDYSGIREGVTVYLPVYQEGALLFVGDGHALEGDGELNGDALETSMDVEFTVDLVRNQSTGGPRFENEEYLMASGIAGSLPDALQQATTELARWLEREYHLSANDSNIVLGTSIRYDIAEVVDPQVHIVAKISKAVLATLK